MEHGLLSIFAAGVFTLFTPCILPMLPVYLSLLLGAGIDSAKSADSRFRLLIASSLFVMGFSLVFTLMGFGASSIGSLLHDYRQALLLIGGVIIALFGLKYLGLIKIGFLDRSVQVPELKTGSRNIDSFLFGLVFALGWTPCVGPILGSVLTYTAVTTQGAWSGALYLFSYSMGVGLPLIGVSLLADRLIPQLKKLNRHLPKFEKATGFVMVMVGLALASPTLYQWTFNSGGGGIYVESMEGSRYLEPSLGDQSELPRLVKFYEENCPACERMKPRFDQLEEECTKREVELLRVNLSDPRNRGIAADMGVRAVPLIKMYGSDGAEKGWILGEREIRDLRAAAGGLMDAVCMGERGRTDFDNEEVVACDSGVAVQVDGGDTSFLCVQTEP